MRFPVATALMLSIVGCDPSGDGPPRIKVEEVRVNLPAVAGRPGAAYFTLHAYSGGAELISISSPRVRTIDLHETVTEGGVTRMVPLHDVLILDTPVRFEPGSKHAMLSGIDPNVKAGDRIPLNFDFEPAADVTVEAEVGGFGESHAGH